MRRGSGGAGGSPGARRPLPPPAPPARPLGAGPARMGWLGGSPCCCPAPPRPRPAGRPPQVSGRAARSGRAAARASRPGSSAGGGRQGARGRRGSRGSGAGAGLGSVIGDLAGRGELRRLAAGKVTRGRGAGRGHTLVGAVTPSPALVRTRRLGTVLLLPATHPRAPRTGRRSSSTVGHVLPHAGPVARRELAAARGHWPGSASAYFPFLLHIWGN